MRQLGVRVNTENAENRHNKEKRFKSENLPRWGAALTTWRLTMLLV
jgi:hypothetical protein